MAAIPGDIFHVRTAWRTSLLAFLSKTGRHFCWVFFHLRERSDKASCGRPNAIDLPFGDDAFCDAYHPLNQTFYWTVYLLMPRMIGFKKDTLSEDIIYPHDKQLCLDFPLYSHRIPMISLFYLYSMPILSS